MEAMQRTAGGGPEWRMCSSITHTFETGGIFKARIWMQDPSIPSQKISLFQTNKFLSFHPYCQLSLSLSLWSYQQSLIAYKQRDETLKPYPKSPINLLLPKVWKDIRTSYINIDLQVNNYLSSFSFYLHVSTQPIPRISWSSLISMLNRINSRPNAQYIY